MENSGDSYLHKKFKKQLSVEPKLFQNEKEISKKGMVEACEEKINHSIVTIGTTLTATTTTTTTRVFAGNSQKPIIRIEDKSNIINSSGIDNQNNTRKDNNDSVPNRSTNQTFVLNSSNVSSSKSSISLIDNSNLANLQSTNACISYVVSSNNSGSDEKQQQQLRPVNFDIKTPTTQEPINPTASTSSILLINNSYNTTANQNYVITKTEDISSHNIQEYKNNLINEPEIVNEMKINNNIDNRSKNEEQQQQPSAQQPPPPDKSTGGGGGGGKYVCQYCNLVCSKPSVLQKHIRAHTNERPYPCDSCGFSFKTRSNLYKHCRSRTHANRVMGNKAQEINNDVIEVSSSNERKSPTSLNNDLLIHNSINNNDKPPPDLKMKPYKPRFHTGAAKQFYNNITTKENINDEDELNINNNKHTNSELLSHHINEIINKNNSIVNSSDTYLLKKRSTEILLNNNNNDYQRIRMDSLYPLNADEPLNLTKNRKRCMSEIVEPVAQKSLIKELLLKNLNSDMQCPHCKMIFQTVTELELHKMRSCKGFVKPGAKYSRSSSVNVASILTQNKNAFDNIPHLQNAVFALKSPGPFLGKTRLVESDKNKSFSFDDGLPSTFQMPLSNERYLLSPLTLPNDTPPKEKKAPVKLFGGEVKITHATGETKSFKIDNSTSDDKFISESGFVEYGVKLSENRVVKSSLQSGGTVLTNKPNYHKQDSIGTNQDIIRVYENSSVSPSLDLTNLNKATKFNFDRQSIEMNERNLDFSQRTTIDNTFNNTSSPSYKYTNIMDFSQNAVKLLTPKLKQPNLAVPGVPAPNKFTFNTTTFNAENKHEIFEFDKGKIDDDLLPQNLTIIPKNDSIVTPAALTTTTVTTSVVQQKMFHSQSKIVTPHTPNFHSNLYNPMNLLVDGKVVRYVPGIPGPVAAEEPMDLVFGSNIISTNPRRSPHSKSETKIFTPTEVVPAPPAIPPPPPPPLQLPPSKLELLEVRTDLTTTPKLIDQIKSPKPSFSDKSSPRITNNQEIKSNFPNEPKKFARPNSLALKPTTASLKQHHGLTPTMFNQILISPDTPRVAKKYVQQFLHGNYFSYLGLKCSTKPVYCTLNKTQPFYVPHFKKLSMYSAWRQQDTKTDKLYVSAYDSRQKHQKYTTAGKTKADLIVHSSYKFIISEFATKGEKNDDQQKSSAIQGGYECDEDYTYIRGRGRGRYVCDQCGIRCKKPSMLKKHIKTHSNDRPYTCNHCNFSFKTKGNLTKHMKSKAHTKNYAATGSSNSSTQQSGTQSSESETEDSEMESSDESTRREEHEAAYGLLSLSQKPTQEIVVGSIDESSIKDRNSPTISNVSLPATETTTVNNVMDTEEIAHISKTSYAKNKFLDEKQLFKITNPQSKLGNDTSTDHQMLVTNGGIYDEQDKKDFNETTKEAENMQRFLGKTTINRPLTYPYTTILPTLEIHNKDIEIIEPVNETKPETKSIKQFSVIQKYGGLSSQSSHHSSSPKIVDNKPVVINKHADNGNNLYNRHNLTKESRPKIIHQSEMVINQNSKVSQQPTPPVLKVNDTLVDRNSPVLEGRKRKLSVESNYSVPTKIQKNDEVMDLSMANERVIHHDNKVKTNGNVFSLTAVQNDSSNINFVKEQQPLSSPLITAVTTAALPAILRSESPTKSFKSSEYDNSAMETLADVATKQVKLEKNTLAKSVATQFLKIATKNEFADGLRDSVGFRASPKEVNELNVKAEGSKSCSICSKSFSKPFQLRLHMNIHYLERPFRCHSCSVSFRTKGHLQKHERSASHHNKLSSSPALSSSEPRPFKCVDCSIAFRIHGHLAKHLRSKMHIMKLECLAKIPFGLYAELERSNSLLTEINTADGDQCLESLKTLAKKVFINDPNKLNQLNPGESLENDDS